VPESPANDHGASGLDPERKRLAEEARRQKNWKRWGPYLSERQWGTVREDYSAEGNPWEYFPHDHARSRTYRWGEDGLLGICDRQCRLCFAYALWNEKDPFLKERLFGLTGPQGNHGEDCKELYYYLESTPTHSYLKALYKYPQREYPYGTLVEENRRRGAGDAEFELIDTGVFDESRYFDVVAEYAKAGPNDILAKLTVSHRGPAEAPLHILPTLWFRNTWLWGCEHEGCTPKPIIRKQNDSMLEAQHDSLGTFVFQVDNGPDGKLPPLLFTENESNSRELWGAESYTPYVKDAFHEYLVHGRPETVSPDGIGTKVAAHFQCVLPAGQSAVLRMRLSAAGEAPPEPFGDEFEATFETRRAEADAFYAQLSSPSLSAEEKNVQRQAWAGLLWTKQFYHYSVHDWLSGDPALVQPPPSRRGNRNVGWDHLFNRDVISMPDKWEYPWYAAWDLAFHMISFARLDPQFSKDQLILMLREWYMHPNGQIPAYEFGFGEVNPPVHAWACWRVYKMTGQRGARDVAFLEKVFHKLLMNFTWWVNRKDPEGRNVFAGGFLGLDNIGVFDRSKPLPTGGHLCQADGTAWMGFFCGTMLAIALELARFNPAYEGVASKFFEHFAAIADAMNTLGGTGLWDEEDGFYYDQLRRNGDTVPLKIRSMVGLVPLFAAEILDDSVLETLPGFRKRMDWFIRHRSDLARHISWLEGSSRDSRLHLLAIPSRERLSRVLTYLLDEREFLSPYGIRSLSKYHKGQPYVFHVGAEEYRVGYLPAESDSGFFGGNSNWRGPIWLPMNYLIVEALQRYHHFYGDSFRAEFPTGSGQSRTLEEIAAEIARRLVCIFVPDPDGRRPCHGDESRYLSDPHFKDLVLFYEYFHGDSGRGLGASHQTGWTALVARLLEILARGATPAA
jgi:hypothetical protein